MSGEWVNVREIASLRLSLFQFESSQLWLLLSVNVTVSLHRSSRRVNKPSLSVAWSRAYSEKSASSYAFSSSNPVPSPPFHSSFPSPSTYLTLRQHFNYSKKQLCSEEPQVIQFLNPRLSLVLPTFNVRTLMQIGKQVSLARTFAFLAIYVCCVSETRIQDVSTVLLIYQAILMHLWWRAEQSYWFVWCW